MKKRKIELVRKMLFLFAIALLGIISDSALALEMQTPTGPAIAGTPSGTGKPSYTISATPQAGWHFNRDASCSGSGYSTARVTVNTTTNAAGLYCPDEGSFTLTLSGTASKDGTSGGGPTPWSVTGIGTTDYWITPPEAVLIVNEEKVFTAHVPGQGDATSSWSSDGRQTDATGTTATYKWASEGKKTVTGTLQSDTSKTDTSDVYVVKIIIKNGTTDVTDATTNIVVGVPVSLTAELYCPDGLTNNDLTEPEWSVQGNVKQGWSPTTQSYSTATVDELEDSEKKSCSVSFYWIDGTSTGVNKDVTFTAKVKGITVSGKTTFKVTRPSVTVTAQSTSPTIIYQYLNYNWLGYGGNGTAGISFSASGVPAGYESEWVQITAGTTTTYSAAYPDNPPTNHTWTDSLDGTYPYATGMSTTDSPNICLLNTFSKASMNASFKMYFLIRKSSNDAWVPMRITNWTWSATGIKDANNVWSIDGNPTHSENTSDTTNYPCWDKVE